MSLDLVLVILIAALAVVNVCVAASALQRRYWHGYTDGFTAGFYAASLALDEAGQPVDPELEQFVTDQRRGAQWQ